MKKLIAYVKPYKLDKVIKALQKIGLEDIYIEEVKEFYLERKLTSFLPRYKIHFYIDSDDELIKEITDQIFEECEELEGTEQRITILDLIESWDIETGEQNILFNKLDIL